ncbi:MAG: hypothetical protein GY809_08510 [Planctomycetes bacterium]|nr:hypothetical protein [Planctomycetota bacterium]
MSTREKTPRKKMKKRYKALLLLTLFVMLAGAIMALLLHKPAGYEPVNLNAQPEEGPTEISRYLTYLYSQMHNNAQKKETFEVEVLEDGINQAIASANWPQRSDDIVFAQPKAEFDEDGITVTGTANVKGVDLVVTIHGLLQMLEDGQSNVHIQTVRIGALNVTRLAKYLAKRMYKERFGMVYVESTDPRVLIAASLLEDKPFDPVFEVNDKGVRLIQTTMEQDLIRLKFEPTP